MQTFRTFGIASAMLVAMSVAVWAQAPRPREGNLKVGDAVPDFVVTNLQGSITVKLSDLKGKPVVLFFGSCT
jgi:cytochrome oxidase Cu insertion factor (SCO1/SenC/PrrC family)